MIIEKISKHLVTEAKQKDDAYTKTAMSPTDADQCVRRTYFKFIKAPSKEKSARTLAIFDLGNAIHERWQKILGDIGIQLKAEQRIEDMYKDMPFHAYVDSICLINNDPYVVELKSMKEWTYGSRDYLPKPKDEHVSQTQLYMHFTGIHKAIILYENKNTSELREFIITYDKAHCERILNILYELWKDVEKKRQPDRPEGLSYDTYPCTYCDFREHCYSDLSESVLDVKEAKK